MQVPDMDDAMAQAVDIGENDVSIIDYIRSSSSLLFLDVSCSETSPDIFWQDDEDDADVEKDDEKVPRNWSVLKETPELRTAKVKSHSTWATLYVLCGVLMLWAWFLKQPKPKKEGRMSLDEAVDDAENLTDFLMDFEEETDP